MAPSLLLVGGLLAAGGRQSLVLDRPGSCLGIGPLGITKMGGDLRALAPACLQVLHLAPTLPGHCGSPWGVLAKAQRARRSPGLRCSTAVSLLQLALLTGAIVTALSA